MSTKILVNNYLNEKIKISINQWGRSGNTSHWNLDPVSGQVPSSESWNRSDDRGFIMTIAMETGGYVDVPYYVQPNSVVDVKPTGVTMNDVQMKPAGATSPDTGTTGYTLPVSNLTGSKIRISINQWGKSGNTSHWTIKDKDTETWEREDYRGFVMTLTLEDSEGEEVSTGYYYVHRTSVIVVRANGVTDRGHAITPVRGAALGAAPSLVR